MNKEAYYERIAERLYTDLGELQHPSGVLEEIADEVDAL
jgi:hypothetical protein